MSPERSSLFLARRTYRLRRLSDAARMLPIAGAILFCVPLLWRSGVEIETVRTTRVMLYIFGLWIALAVIAGLMSKRLRPTGTEADPPGPQE